MHLYIYNIKMFFFPIQKYLSTISNTLIDIRDMMKAFLDGQSSIYFIITWVYIFSPLLQSQHPRKAASSEADEQFLTVRLKYIFI